MKYFGIIVGLLLTQVVQAETITVGNVRVSVKADSAASARDQALDQAHQLAFQKLINENFPENTNLLPPQDVLNEMVSDFSIDREKTTPTSYTAYLTFQFNEPQVLSWFRRSQQPSSSLSLEHHRHGESGSCTLTASYTTHAEWQYIKKTLENFPDIQALSIFTLSPKNANMKITYEGPMEKLQRGLLQKNLLLTQQEGGWVVSSSELTLR